MNNDPKTIILEFLDIIGYENDRVSHAEEFLQLCQQRAVYSVLNKLPEEKQKEIIEELKINHSPEAIVATLQKYATKEEYSTALTHVTEQSFQEYLTQILPTLSGEQMKKVGEYFQKLSSQNPQVQ